MSNDVQGDNCYMKYFEDITYSSVEISKFLDDSGVNTCLCSNVNKIVKLLKNLEQKKHFMNAINKLASVNMPVETLSSTISTLVAKLPDLFNFFPHNNNSNIVRTS